MRNLVEDGHGRLLPHLLPETNREDHRKSETNQTHLIKNTSSAQIKGVARSPLLGRPRHGAHGEELHDPVLVVLPGRHRGRWRLEQDGEVTHLPLVLPHVLPQERARDGEPGALLAGSGHPPGPPRPRSVSHGSPLLPYVSLLRRRLGIIYSREARLRFRLLVRLGERESS